MLLDLLQPQDKTIISININNPLVEASIVDATPNIGQQDLGVIAEDTIKIIIVNSPKMDNTRKKGLLKGISPDIKQSPNRMGLDQGILVVI